MFSFNFFLNYRNNWKITKYNKKWKEKNIKRVLVKSKLNYIKTLVSQALIDMEIRHEEFFTILNEKDKYEKMKEDIRTMKSSDEGKKIETAEL